jgi:DNA-directed RNA polymerase sigma subunit (sigma70/sigma32)
LTGGYASAVKSNAYTRQLAAWRLRRERIRAMHRRGLTGADIGKRFDISKQRVAQIIAGEK